MLMAESKILADEHGLGAERFDQHVPHELFGRELSNFARERKNQDLTDAFLLHEAAALLRRCHQARRTRGGHNPRGMRIESENGRFPAIFAGYLAHPPQNSRMSRVHTVEIADGERGWSESSPGLFQTMEDPSLHASPVFYVARTLGSAASSP